MNELYSLIDDLARKHTLALEEYEALIKGRNPSLAAYAAQKAVPVSYTHLKKVTCAYFSVSASRTCVLPQAARYSPKLFFSETLSSS